MKHNTICYAIRRNTQSKDTYLSLSDTAKDSMLNWSHDLYDYNIKEDGSKVWEKQANKCTEIFTIPNSFDKIEILENTTIANSSQGGKRVHIPITIYQGQEYYNIEIHSDYFFQLLRDSIVDKGIIKGDFTIFSDRSLCIVDKHTDRYEKYIENIKGKVQANAQKTIPDKDLIVGHVYQCENGREEVYLGKANLESTKMYDREWRVVALKTPKYICAHKFEGGNNWFNPYLYGKRPWVKDLGEIVVPDMESKMIQGLKNYYNNQQIAWIYFSVDICCYPTIEEFLEGLENLENRLRQLEWKYIRELELENKACLMDRNGRKKEMICKIKREYTIKYNEQIIKVETPFWIG